MSEMTVMLSELARMDSVEAIAVGDGDHLAGHVESWCELVLDLEYGGQKRRVQLTRHDAELVVEVLWSVLHPNQHRSSPVQKLWVMLDEQMDYIMADAKPEPEDKIRARALAEAIVLCSQPMVQPESVDVEGVRDEAMDRWEERQ